MKKSRFSEEQIIGILKQHESGVKTAEIAERGRPENLCSDNVLTH
jgi:hypothetical protein